MTPKPSSSGQRAFVAEIARLPIHRSGCFLSRGGVLVGLGTEPIYLSGEGLVPFSATRSYSDGRLGFGRMRKPTRPARKNCRRCDDHRVVTVRPTSPLASIHLIMMQLERNTAVTSAGSSGHLDAPRPSSRLCNAAS